MSTCAEPADVECPTCGAWVGWACEGESYGYHGAGYHPARERVAARAAFEALLARSSIGAAMDDIKKRGIDAHLVDLEQDRRPTRKT